MPEALQTEAASESLPVLPGACLLGAAAVLLLIWRRGIGQSPILALLPGLLLLAHPALQLALTSRVGLVDLTALATLLLGAYLLTVERSGLVAAGVVLLFLPVLLAPAGASFAALAAFVLIERVPTMYRGAGLLLMYGCARALGVPSPFRLLGIQEIELGPAAATLPERLLASAAALIPDRPVLAVPGHEPMAVGIGLVVLLLLGALLLRPERRFGGPFTAGLALVALLLLALDPQRSGGVALAAPLILFAVWVVSLGDDVEPGRFRPAVAWSVAVALLVVLGVKSVRLFPLLESREAFFAAAGRADPELARSDDLARISLRAELGRMSPQELDRLLDRHLLVESPPSSAAAAVDRELAIAAVGVGLLEPADELLSRARRMLSSSAAGDGATEAGDPGARGGSHKEVELAIGLDRMDLALRRREPSACIAEGDRLLSLSPAAQSVAEIRARQGLAHAVLALGPAARSGSATDRDRELLLARQRFDQAIAADPGCVRARLAKGRFHLAQGESIDAVKSLEECVRLRPDLVAPRLELAKLYFSRGQVEAGERWLEEARTVSPEQDPGLTLVLAHLLLARGDLLGAVRHAEWLQERVHRLRGGPEELANLFATIARLAEDGRNDGLAETMSRLALHHGSDSRAESTTRLLRLLRKGRRYDEMVELLNSAASRGIPVPEFGNELSQALKNAGYARFLAQDRQLARQRFLSAVAESEDFADLGAIPSLLRVMTDEMSQEQRDLLTAQARRAFESGVRQIEKGRHDEAIRLLRISLEFLPNNPFAHFHLGIALDRLGQPEQAGVELEKALLHAQAMGREDLVEQIRALISER